MMHEKEMEALRNHAGLPHDMKHPMHGMPDPMHPENRMLHDPMHPVNSMPYHDDPMHPANMRHNPMDPSGMNQPGGMPKFPASMNPEERLKVTFFPHWFFFSSTLLVFLRNFRRDGACLP